MAKHVQEGISSGIVCLSGIANERGDGRVAHKVVQFAVHCCMMEIQSTTNLWPEHFFIV
uniref:Uncharacterized protein n=1 Tax=Anguilla anguilla TaxID=7936 RepID=A0A0E9XF99_ANGAN